MKSLNEYLATATHYLYPDMTSKQLSEERNRAIEYCTSRGLEEKFQMQVNAWPDWKKLADTKEEVEFFIEEPLKINPGSERNAFVKTGVFIRILDTGKSAVIKIVM